jgi:D-alanyl-D-alanine carboxypeptidase
VTTDSGEELIFAIYANQAQGDLQVRARMDRFVEILASSQNPALPLPASAATTR